MMEIKALRQEHGVRFRPLQPPRRDGEFSVAADNQRLKMSQGTREPHCFHSEDKMNFLFEYRYLLMT